MFILYLDESGGPANQADRNFVLAGAAIFERQTFFLSEALNRLQSKSFPQVLTPIELHASAIRSGRGPWRRLTKEHRTELLQEMCGVITDRKRRLVLFGACVEKTPDLSPDDVVRRATEEVCAKFDTFLTRRYHTSRDRARGLVVFDEGRFANRSRVWVEDFRVTGTHWGATLRNLADIPYFAPSEATRLLQIADLVAHAIYLLYERNEADLFKRLLPAFDQAEGTLHGLAHITPSRAICPCPACDSRRTPGSFGPWMSA